MFLNLKTKFDDVSLPKSYSLNSSGSFKRLELKGNTFSTIVIGNFDLVTATKKPNFDRLGMWYEYLTGDSLLVNDVNMDLVLSAGDYRIYTSQKIDNPFLNIGNVSRKNIPQNNAMKVYPNPSNGETFQIQWSENAEYGRLRIYETTGRTVYSGDIKSGETVFTELSAGVYFISVESQEKRYLSKIWVD
jgi:hypothetical protein